jgi:hypothetical protein
MLSLLTLERLNPDADRFIDASQCGFRRGRSSAEVIWTYAWIKANAWRYQRIFYILGIDMSKAFDTVLRAKLVWIIEQISSVDVARLVRILMSNTTCRVTVKNILGPAFETTIGIPQGDGLSPVLFVIYLEAAMRDVRNADAALYGFGRWGIVPTNLSYADDVDTFGVCKLKLDAIASKSAVIFIDWNLHINLGKTEHKEIRPTQRAHSDYKKLGSHIDIDRNVSYRIQQAEGAMGQLWKLWGRTIEATSLATRLRVYNVYVLAVLLYNVEAAALAERHILKLEQTHRRHLRRLARVFYPNIISNEALYERAKTQSLRTIIITRRLNFLAKVLQQPRLHPAREAMEQYYRHLDEAPKVRGRPQHMPALLESLFQHVNLSFRTWGDFEVVRDIATNRPQRWKEITAEIIRRNALQADEARDVKKRRRLIAEARRGRSTHNLTIGDIQDQQGNRKVVRAIEDGKYRYYASDSVNAYHDNVLLYSRVGNTRIRLTIGNHFHRTATGLPGGKRLTRASPQQKLGPKKRTRHAVAATDPLPAPEQSSAEPHTPVLKKTKLETARQTRDNVRTSIAPLPTGQDHRAVRRLGQHEAYQVDLNGREETA